MKNKDSKKNKNEEIKKIPDVKKQEIDKMWEEYQKIRKENNKD